MLNKKTRVKLILAAERKLRGEPVSALNVILDTFGLQTWGPNDPLGQLHEIIKAATDEVLVELAEYLQLDVPDVGAPESHVATVSSARPLFVFGSHLTEQRVLVGAVSQGLRRYGIELFVAHDSIDHDSLWQAEIEKALDRADAGLVFVHQGLKESAWCDQEIGWLQGRKVPVMALSFDLTPYGFFAKHQAQKVRPDTRPEVIAEQTVDRIAGKPELAQGFAASLVAAMVGSPNFATTDAIWKRLRELSTLDADLCSQLLEATKNNNQIYWANSAQDSGEPYSRVVSAFLRRQPGGAVIASDIDAYAAYLDQQEAEARERAAASSNPSF